MQQMRHNVTNYIKLDMNIREAWGQSLKSDVNCPIMGMTILETVVTMKITVKVSPVSAYSNYKSQVHLPLIDTQ